MTARHPDFTKMDYPVQRVAGDAPAPKAADGEIWQTAERIPVKIAILNNAYLGMVRQWQEMFYDERYSSVFLDSANVPDFVMMAESMGCVGILVE